MAIKRDKAHVFRGSFADITLLLPILVPRSVYGRSGGTDGAFTLF